MTYEWSTIPDNKKSILLILLKLIFRKKVEKRIIQRFRISNRTVLRSDGIIKSFDKGSRVISVTVKHASQDRVGSGRVDIV